MRYRETLMVNLKVPSQLSITSAGPQEEPWLTRSCLGEVRPTLTVQRGGRSMGTRAITCSWWLLMRSATPWGWSTPPSATPSCPRTTGSWAAAWCSAGTTSLRFSSFTVSYTQTPHTSIFVMTFRDIRVARTPEVGKLGSDVAR